MTRDILHAIGMVDDERLVRCEKNRNPSVVIHREGCAIVYALKMENLWIADSNGDKLIFSDDGMTIIGTESVDQQVLTLAGLKGTAAYKAAIEWYEFKQKYDPNRSIYAEIANDGKIPEFPEEYDGYSLYSQEMKDALDAILKKSGLKPQGARLNFRTVKNMCKALGIERIQITENSVTVNVDTGGCYEN